MAPMREGQAGDLDALRRLLEERFRPRDYREAQELVVAACQEAQRLLGWVSPEAAELIAEHLGVTTNRIYGLLTFYADFRTEPPGRHFLWVCYGAACYVAGAGRLVEFLQERCGISGQGTTADGSVTVQVFNGCLGVCDLAPVAQLDHREYVGQLSVERLQALLRRLQGDVDAGGLDGATS